MQDTERSYKGTNFAVITLIALLAMVGIYYLTAQVNDFSDDTRDIAPAATVEAPTSN